MHQHLHAPVPDASPLRPGLHPEVDHVLARGMAKNPVDRYATAGEFAKDLRDALALVRADGVRDGIDSGSAPRAGQHTAHLPTSPATKKLTAEADDVAQAAYPGVAPVAGSAPSGSRLPASYLGSARHFTGLALVSLIVPLYLLGVVQSGWRLLVSGLLLYALGAVVHAIVRAVRS